MSTKELSTDSELRTGAYLRATKWFFVSSKLFEAQVTDVFDRLWPTITALKMLRWQVRGFYEELDVKSNERLAQRFVDAEDKTWRPNLYRVCLQQSWSQMEESLAKDLLINLIARFEGWCENILRDLGYTKDKDIRNYSGDLQNIAKIQSFLAGQDTGADPSVKNAFFSVYEAASRCNSHKLIDNFKYYRFFKECRNSIIHNGERTTQKILDCKIALSSVSETDLSIEELPETPCNALDEPVVLSLRGVVGFSQILLNIVSIIDTELIKADKTKLYFISQLKKYNPGKPSAYPTRKINSEIKSFCKRSYFKVPINPGGLYPVMKQGNLMR